VAERQAQATHLGQERDGRNRARLPRWRHQYSRPPYRRLSTGRIAPLTNRGAVANTNACERDWGDRDDRAAARPCEYWW
jgi:hypothetical protein